MQPINNDNFGPLVAYLVPGATVLFGFSQFSPTLQAWFAATPMNAPSIGGFLYLTVASIAAGMTLNAVRWAVLDTIHSWTGLQLPPLDFSRLGQNVAAFSLLIDIHYKHYQFHGAMWIATAITYVCYRVKLGSVLPLSWIDAGFVVVEIIFYAMSRDTLRRYHTRSAQLLGNRHPQRLNDWTDIDGGSCPRA